MKTTIDLPEEILYRAKILAAQQRSTLKDVILAGLDHVLGNAPEVLGQEAPLSRLRSGFHLGGNPLSRNEIHARR